MAQRGEQVTPAGAESFRIPPVQAVDIVHLHPLRRRPGPGTPHMDDPLSEPRREGGQEQNGRQTYTYGDSDAWSKKRSELLAPTSTVTAKDIKDRFGVSLPTVRRDIDHYVQEQVARIRAEAEVDPGETEALRLLDAHYREEWLRSGQERPEGHKGSPVVRRIRRRLDELQHADAYETTVNPKAVEAYHLKIAGVDDDEIGRRLTIDPNSVRAYVATGRRAVNPDASRRPRRRSSKRPQVEPAPRTEHPLVRRRKQRSEQIVAMWDNHTIAEIAAATGLSESGVKHHAVDLRKAGVPLSSKGGTNENSHRHRSERHEQLVRGYRKFAPGRSKEQIAALLNIDVRTVYSLAAEIAEQSEIQPLSVHTTEVTVFSGTSQGDLAGAAHSLGQDADVPLRQRNADRRTAANNSPPRRRRQAK